MMDDDFDLETRFIHREETFTDHAVDELAKLKAKCLCRIQYGSCKESECSNCNLHKALQQCEDSMSPYDRARVSSYTGRHYVKYSSIPEAWLPPRGILFRLLRVLLVVAISVALILILINTLF